MTPHGLPTGKSSVKFALGPVPRPSRDEYVDHQHYDGRTVGWCSALGHI